MTILILAAGQQQRWGDGPIKQLLPIGNTTILGRMVNQVDNKGIIVTHRQEIISKFSTILVSEERVFNSDLKNTSPYWFSQVVILLGDVIYSYNTLNKILAHRGVLRAFGNKWEIFALSFNNHSDVKMVLQETVKQAKLGLHKGTLRNFFWNYTNTDNKSDIKHPAFEVICSITDYTNDIDSPEEYEAFLKQHLQTMIHDDDNQR